MLCVGSVDDACGGWTSTPCQHYRSEGLAYKKNRKEKVYCKIVLLINRPLCVVVTNRKEAMMPGCYLTHTHSYVSTLYLSHSNPKITPPSLTCNNKPKGK